LAENHFAYFVEERRRRVGQFSLQRFPALEIRESRQLARWKLEERFHPAVNVGALRSGWRLLSRHQLGDVGLGHLGGRSQVPLLGAELLESMTDDHWKIHVLVPRAPDDN